MLSWRQSNTMEVLFCVEALPEALGKGTPEVINSDQGSQFTSEDVSAPLIAIGISISMGGKGGALDNAFAHFFVGCSTQGEENRRGARHRKNTIYGNSMEVNV